MRSIIIAHPVRTVNPQKGANFKGNFTVFRRFSGERGTSGGRLPHWYTECGSIEVQQRQRHTSKEHPALHGLFAAPEGVERARAARKQHDDQPRRLQPQRREAEAGDVEIQLGGGDHGEQEAFGQDARTQQQNAPFLADRLRTRARHQPQQRKVDRHHAAQREEALPRVFRDGIALGEGAGERAEEIAGLKAEECEIDGGKNSHDGDPDAERHLAERPKAGLDSLTASAERLDGFAARPGNEAEEVCANREAEQEAPENKLVNLRRQQSQKALCAVLKYGVRAGQLLHGQHQQAQRGGQREDDRKDDDRLTLFIGAAQMRQRIKDCADAQEKVLRRENDRAVQRVERQKMAAFAAAQPPGAAEHPIDRKAVRKQQAQVAPNAVAAQRCAQHRHGKAAQPDPAFKAALLLPMAPLGHGDKERTEDQKGVSGIPTAAVEIGGDIDQ